MHTAVYPTSSPQTTSCHNSARAFTLVELMVAVGLASFISAGVLSTFVMLGRNFANAANYTDLETQARNGLELFSREVREAYNVESYSSTSVTLDVPYADTAVITDTTIPASPTTHNTQLYRVTYTFDTTTNNFIRTGPPITNPTGASATMTLIANVKQIGSVDPMIFLSYVSGNYSDGFSWSGGQPANAANNVTSIKQIELNFTAQRNNSATVATATNKVISACFILRNK